MKRSRRNQSTRFKLGIDGEGRWVANLTCFSIGCGGEILSNQPRPPLWS